MNAELILGCPFCVHMCIIVDLHKFSVGSDEGRQVEQFFGEQARKKKRPCIILIVNSNYCALYPHNLCTELVKGLSICGWYSY